MLLQLIATSNLVCFTSSYSPPSSSGANFSAERDDKDAIDQSNILSGGRTRGAKPEGTYQEPGDTEGLPEDNGKSAIAQ
jgi:hypothetical protein